MRALRVLGLADAPDAGAGKNLVCEDPSSGEQFSIACDDRLRAGARGDLSRFGQLEIEMQSQLRPREIQARIRAGATVEQVAALAGTTSARVERFAYPVLLERASVVTRAMKARPAIDGITAGASVADTVAATLSARGHDGEVTWDAYKDDDGWVLALTWSAGRSENSAHWLFHPGPDGGTLSARDEAAAEIVDPALRILRPLRPVRQEAASLLLDPTLPTERLPRAGEKSRPGDGATRPAEPASRSTHPAGSKLPTATSTVPVPTGRPGSGSSRTSRFGAQPAQDPSPVGTSSEQAVEEIRVVEAMIADERTGVNPVVVGAEAARTGTDSAARALPTMSSAQPRAMSTNVETVSGADPTSPADLHIAATGSDAAADKLPDTPGASVTTGAAQVNAGRSTAAPSSASPAAGTSPAATGSRPATGSAPAASSRPARRGQRPVMPSWEDVLLGTRSSSR